MNATTPAASDLLPSVVIAREAPPGFVLMSLSFLAETDGRAFACVYGSSTWAASERAAKLARLINGASEAAHLEQDADKARQTLIEAMGSDAFRPECSLHEGAALIVSQRDNAREEARVYRERAEDALRGLEARAQDAQRMAEDLDRLRVLILAERKRYAEAEALLLRAAQHLDGHAESTGGRSPAADTIRATLERHKLERTASPRAQAEALIT